MYQKVPKTHPYFYKQPIKPQHCWDPSFMCMCVCVCTQVLYFRCSMTNQRVAAAASAPSAHPSRSPRRTWCDRCSSSPTTCCWPRGPPAAASTWSRSVHYVCAEKGVYADFGLKKVISDYLKSYLFTGKLVSVRIYLIWCPFFFSLAAEPLRLWC